MNLASCIDMGMHVGSDNTKTVDSKRTPRVHGAYSCVHALPLRSYAPCMAYQHTKQVIVVLKFSIAGACIRTFSKNRSW
jgi:hypothetical protein